MNMSGTMRGRVGLGSGGTMYRVLAEDKSGLKQVQTPELSSWDGQEQDSSLPAPGMHNPAQVAQHPYLYPQRTPHSLEVRLTFLSHYMITSCSAWNSSLCKWCTPSSLGSASIVHSPPKPRLTPQRLVTFVTPLNELSQWSGLPRVYSLQTHLCLRSLLPLAIPVPACDRVQQGWRGGGRTAVYID